MACGRGRTGTHLFLSVNLTSSNHLSLVHLRVTGRRQRGRGQMSGQLWPDVISEKWTELNLLTLSINSNNFQLCAMNCFHSRMSGLGTAVFERFIRLTGQAVTPALSTGKLHSRIQTLHNSSSSTSFGLIYITSGGQLLKSKEKFTSAEGYIIHDI